VAQIPDFGGLASQQKTANDQAATQTNWASRPNQYNAFGSTTWGYDPTSQQWSQNTNLAGGAQGLFDQTMQGQQGLLGSVVSGAPQANFGAQQNVIDAWNSLQRPGLDAAAEQQRARAAAMGLTVGSEANNAIERNIGTNEATSRNQGILQGVNAWNQLYQNQLAGFNANRGALGDVTNVRNSLNPNAWNAKVPTPAAYTPETIYGAAQDTFNAQRQNENAALAASQGNTQGYIDALKAAGGISGLATGAKDLWSAGKGLWDSWGSGGNLPAPVAFPDLDYGDMINFGL